MNEPEEIQDGLLLSICIPTYSRSNSLRMTLQSIAQQICDDETLDNAIEIVISDNASTDDTSLVAESFRHRFKHFTYAKNSVNLGFDQNIVNVVSIANGKYCWYFGDDDLMINDGIRLVHELLRTDNYDFINVESTDTFTTSDKETAQHSQASSLISTSNPSDFYFNGYCQGILSVLVFRRGLWLDVLDAKKYLEHWLYYETILKLIANSNKELLYVNKPLVLTGHDCRWAQNGTELYTFINSNILLEKMYNWGYDKNLIQENLIANCKSLPLIILRAKGHGLNMSIVHLKYIYKHMGRSGPGIFFASTAVFFIPNFIVIFMRDLRKNIINKRRIYGNK